MIGEIKIDQVGTIGTGYKRFDNTLIGLSHLFEELTVKEP